MTPFLGARRRRAALSGSKWLGVHSSRAHDYRSSAAHGPCTGWAGWLCSTTPGDPAHPCKSEVPILRDDSSPTVQGQANNIPCHCYADG